MVKIKAESTSRDTKISNEEKNKGSLRFCFSRLFFRLSKKRKDFSASYIHRGGKKFGKG